MGIGSWELSDSEFEQYYGLWTPRTPTDAVSFFDGYPGTWWIAGGYAIEAFTGAHRRHEDCDPAILLDELELFREHARERGVQLWSCSSGMMRPVFASLPAGDERLLIEGSGQLWIRESLSSPWEYDCLLSPGSSDIWVYKRDPSITMPMADALWTKDGVRYLRPQIQLLYKAAGLRPKDQLDFDACRPLLDDEARSWLRGALVATLGDEHPWVAHLT